MLLAEGEPLKLRIFIDKSVVEVFMNDKGFLGRRVFPEPDSTKISFIAHGRDGEIDRFDAYEMKDVNTALNMQAL